MAIGRRIFSRTRPAIPSKALGTVIHKPAIPSVRIQPRPNGNAGSLTIIAVITPNNTTVKLVQSTARARKPRGPSTTWPTPILKATLKPLRHSTQDQRSQREVTSARFRRPNPAGKPLSRCCIETFTGTDTLLCAGAVRKTLGKHSEIKLEGLGMLKLAKLESGNARLTSAQRQRKRL